MLSVLKGLITRVVWALYPECPDCLNDTRNDDCRAHVVVCDRCGKEWWVYAASRKGN